MKTKLLTTLTVLLFIQFSNAQQYHWIQRATFPGGNRYAAVGFSVGNYGYAGLGLDYVNGAVVYHNDFWKYDPQLNSWTQLGNFPGTMRHGAACFVNGNKAYVTTGWMNSTALRDLWEYEPSTDSWVQLTNFGGTARYMPTAFVLRNKAYVGTGYSPYKKDFWSYSFLNNSWSQVADIGGMARQGARSFTANGYGYVYGGANVTMNPVSINQLWQYNDTTNAWTQKASSPGPGRNVSAVFKIQDKVFIGTGLDNVTPLQDFYIYDANTNSWTPAGNFSGGTRIESISFSINDIGYVGLGSTSPLPAGQVNSDFWAYGPEPGPLTISGSSGFCRPSTNNIYSLPSSQNGVTYNWAVPAGASITSGQGTSSITVSFAANASAGTLSVTATNIFGVAAASKSLIIRSNVSATPGTITGSNVGCDGDCKHYTIKKVSTADYYIWTPPAGATINGSSSAFSTPDTGVVVCYGPSFTGDSLHVRSGNCKGISGDRKLRINKTNPSTPGTISGLNVGLCNLSGVSYSINTVSSATSYTWRTNIAGATINGNPSPFTTTSTSVTVNFGTFTTGQIYVKSNNGCGSSAERSLNVNAKPAVPSSITGPVTLCTNQAGNNYSTVAVANASGYNWTLPSGATITSGQGTTAILMKAGTNPVTGNVRVRSQNICASSAYISKSVTINNCPRLEGENSISENLYIEVYPIPASGILNIAIETESQGSYRFDLTDISGRSIRIWNENVMSGRNLFEVNTDNYPSGIYNLSVSGNGIIRRIRVLVQ